MRGSKNILNLVRSAIYRVKNKDNSFPIFGLKLVLGAFGSGKTLTAVDKVYDYLDSFSDCRLVTNVEFKNLNKNEYYYTDNEYDFIHTLIQVLSTDNEKGCICVIDEVKGFLPNCLANNENDFQKAFFTILSQVRKLHCLMIITSQLYSKVPKILRDFILQNGDIVICKKLIPGFTYYMYYDMTTIEETTNIKLKGKFKSFNYLFHSPELYQAYDSHAIVSRY